MNLHKVYKIQLEISNQVKQLLRQTFNGWMQLLSSASGSELFNDGSGFSLRATDLDPCIQGSEVCYA